MRGDKLWSRVNPEKVIRSAISSLEFISDGKIYRFQLVWNPSFIYLGLLICTCANQDRLVYVIIEIFFFFFLKGGRKILENYGGMGLKKHKGHWRHREWMRETGVAFMGRFGTSILPKPSSDPFKHQGVGQNLPPVKPKANSHGPNPINSTTLFCLHFDVSFRTSYILGFTLKAMFEPISAPQLETGTELAPPRPSPSGKPRADEGPGPDSGFRASSNSSTPARRAHFRVSTEFLHFYRVH